MYVPVVIHTQCVGISSTRVASRRQLDDASRTWGEERRFRTGDGVVWLMGRALRRLRLMPADYDMLDASGFSRALHPAPRSLTLR